jgi:hypothetical protein
MASFQISLRREVGQSCEYLVQSLIGIDRPFLASECCAEDWKFSRIASHEPFLDRDRLD